MSALILFAISCGGDTVLEPVVPPSSLIGVKGCDSGSSHPFNMFELCVRVETVSSTINDVIVSTSNEGRAGQVEMDRIDVVFTTSDTLPMDDAEVVWRDSYMQSSAGWGRTTSIRVGGLLRHLAVESRGFKVSCERVGEIYNCFVE